MGTHLAMNINIPNRTTIVLILRFIAQFIKTNKISLTVLLCRFKDFKGARQFLRTFVHFSRIKNTARFYGKFKDDS